MLSLRRLQSRAPRPRALLGLGAAALGAVSLFEANKALASRRDSAEAPRSDERVIDNRDVKPRAEHLRRLRDEQFDMLVIGGGVTGCGIALDAVTRGLSVAMVEQDDYSAGTSSRSTKLIHGGVRYLEKAFKNLDWGQFELVREALTERQHLLHIAPHLSRPLPIIVPFYQPFPTALFAIPYYWVGVKMYDLFAGSEGLLEPSYFMSRRSVRERFPMLSEKGLKGAMVYFDGQHNDSRMNLMIALTAAAKGAAVANHVSVVSLTQDESKTVTGAVVRDELTGDSWAVKARVTVNATGPFADSIRKMARPELAAQPIIMPSSGVHIVLSDRFSPGGMGMIVPQTTDGRVLFLLPWEGSTLAGTTDSSSDITTLPRPRAEEVNFILKELSHFMRTEIRPDDVDAAWSGIRPLARDPAAKSTASASRDHVIEPTAPGLYTIAGGKWTTYRSMAENLVDRVLEDSAPLREKAKGPCITKRMKLLGGHGFSLGLPTMLFRLGMPQDVADHLAHNYGDKCLEVAEIAKKENKEARLAYGYPFIEAEVLYSCRNEHAMTAVDVLGRRTRLGFLNSDAAMDALPRVIALMAEANGWNQERRISEFFAAHTFLDTMNQRGRVSQVSKVTENEVVAKMEERVKAVFNDAVIRAAEIADLKQAFDAVDVNHDSRIARSQLFDVIKRTKIFGVHNNPSIRGPGDLPDSLQKFINSFPDDDVDLEELLFTTANKFGRRGGAHFSPAQHKGSTSAAAGPVAPSVAAPKASSAAAPVSTGKAGSNASTCG